MVYPNNPFELEEKKELLGQLGINTDVYEKDYSPAQIREYASHRRAELEPAIEPAPIQQVAPVAPVQPLEQEVDRFADNTTGEDLARQAGTGVNSSVSGIGWLLEKVGEVSNIPVLRSFGADVQRITKENMNFYREGLTPGAIADKQRSFTSTDAEGNLGLGDFNLGKILTTLSQGLGSSLPSMGGGAVGTQILAKSLLRNSPRLAGALGTGAAAGTIEGSNAAQDLFETVISTPEDVIAQSPIYQQLDAALRNARPDIPEAQRFEFTRDYLANQVARDGGVLTGLFSAGTSLPFGTLLGKLGIGSKGASRESIRSALFKGFVFEGGQESLEEGFQAIVGNYGRYVAGDKNVNAFDNVAEGAATGFVGGSGTGALIGASGAAIQPAALPDDLSNIDTNKLAKDVPLIEEARQIVAKEQAAKAAQPAPVPKVDQTEKKVESEKEIKDREIKELADQINASSDTVEKGDLTRKKKAKIAEKNAIVDAEAPTVSLKDQLFELETKEEKAEEAFLSEKDPVEKERLGDKLDDIRIERAEVLKQAQDESFAKETADEQARQEAADEKIARRQAAIEDVVEDDETPPDPADAEPFDAALTDAQKSARDVLARKEEQAKNKPEPAAESPSQIADTVAVEEQAVEQTEPSAEAVPETETVIVQTPKQKEVVVKEKKKLKGLKANKAEVKKAEKKAKTPAAKKKVKEKVAKLEEKVEEQEKVVETAKKKGKKKVVKAAVKEDDAPVTAKLTDIKKNPDGKGFIVTVDESVPVVMKTKKKAQQLVDEIEADPNVNDSVIKAKAKAINARAKDEVAAARGKEEEAKETLDTRAAARVLTKIPSEEVEAIEEAQEIIVEALSVAGNTTIGVSEKIIAGLKAEKAKFKSPNGKKAKALQARIERVEALVAAFKEAQRSNQGVARDRTLEKAITEDYIQLLMSESTLSELIDKATALDIDVDKRLSIASQLSASQDDKFNQIKVTGAELDEDSDSDKRVLAEAIAKKTSREEIKATKQSVQDYRDFLGEGRGDALLVAKHREAYRALVKLKARLAESPGKAELKQIEKQARAQHKIVTDIEQVFSGIQELATFKPANTDLSKQKIAQSIVERHDGDEKAYVKDTKPEAIRADAKSLGIRTTKKQSAENIASKIFTFNSGGGPIKFTQLQVKKAEKARKKFQKQTQSIIDTMNVGLKNVDTGTLGTSRKSKDKEVIKTRIIRKAFNKIDILRAEVRKVSAAAGIDPEAILGTVSYKDLGANDRLAKLLGNVRQRRFDLGQAAIDSETQVVSKTAGFKGEIADESVLSNEEEIAQLTREQEIDDVTTEVYGEEIVSESQRDPLDILQEEEESGGSVYTGGGNFGKRGETKKFLGSKLQDKEIVDTDEGIALLPRLRKGQGLVITVGEGQAGFFSTNPDDGSVNVGNTGLAYHHEAFKNYDVIEVYKHDTNKLNELAIVHIRIPKVKNSVAKPEITYVTKHIKDDGRKTSAAKASEVSNAMPWVDVTTVAQIAYAKVMGSMPKSKQSADIQIAELLNEGYNAVRTEASKNDANPFYSALGTGSDLMTRTAKARQDAMLTSAGMTEVGETLASEPTGKKTDAAKKIDQTVSGLKKLSPETKEGTAVHNFGLDVKAAKEFADSVLERRQEFKEEKARLDAPSKSEDQATGKADYKMFKDDPDNQNYCGV